MGIEENKAVVRRFMQLFSESRLDEAFELLDNQVRWSLWGSGPGSGSYTKASMKDLLLQSWAWFDGPVMWIPIAFTAEGDRVAVEAKSSAVTRGGHHNQGEYHNLFRVSNGRIVEVREKFVEGHVQVLFKVLEAEAAAPIRSLGPE